MIGKSKAPRKSQTTRAALLSPLYTENTPHNLGGALVGGPVAGKPTPDPLGFASFDLQGKPEGKSKPVELPAYRDVTAMVSSKPVTGVRESKIK